MTDSANNKSNQWVALGVFAQPHGVSGRIKVKSLSNGAEDFTTVPTLTDDRGNVIKLRVTGHAQGMSIVEIEGITKREQAELLRGRKIGAPRAALPAHESPNRFYISDLIDLNVVTEKGESFGMVRDVVNYGASDILVIKKASGGEELFAFTHATFPEINLSKSYIIISVPEFIYTEKHEKTNSATNIKLTNN